MDTAHKVLSKAACLQRCKQWQANGQQVVFTNGCFDVLHVGHVGLLERARAAGGCLIVGLNSDASVVRLKGSPRPVNPFHARARLLAALSAVDIVVGFEEDTPAALIAQLLPDVLVKGGDYKEADVVGASIVKKHGGTVSIIPLIYGYSSSSCLEKMVRAQRGVEEKK